jgi:hypothetical protein
MSHKTENWQEALQRVRVGLAENTETPVTEKTEDEIISEEIDALIGLLEDDKKQDALKDIPSAGDKFDATKLKDSSGKPLYDTGIKEQQERLEGMLTKLTEKNMLGRLAKSMELNEDNKQKLFDYFESGELEQ